MKREDFAKLKDGIGNLTLLRDFLSVSDKATGSARVRLGFTICDSMRICAHGRVGFWTCRILTEEARMKRLVRVLSYAIKW